MKKFVYILLIAMFIGMPIAHASSYYINDLGVEFTEAQYNYITDIYYDGYQDEMTQDEFDKIYDLDLFNQPIEIVEEIQPIQTGLGYGINSTSVTENGRTTRITKSCSSECLVTLTATWNAIPTVNSYDVIGFRLSSASINTVGKATINGSGYSVTYASSSAQQSSNGFGHSVKLGGVSGMKVTTFMYCSTGGNVYGSYQHAMSSITLANSKLYTIGAGGYGYVFNFYGNASGKYDNAVGVYTSL